MKLYAYPHVVQQEIIRHLSLVDLLIFSSCSNIHKQTLQIIGKHAFTKTEKIVYNSNNMNSFEVCEGIIKKFIVTADAEVGDRNMVKTRLFGMDLLCCFSEQPLTILCAKENVNVLLKSIHIFIYGLFGLSTTYALVTKNNSHIPILEHIKHSAHDLDYSEENAENLEHFLTASPKLEYINIQGEECGKFLEIPKLAEIHTLHITGRDVGTMKMIKGFRGKVLCILCSRMTNYSLVQFLNEWKTGEGFVNENLKYLRLRNSTMYGLGFDRDSVAEKLEFKKFDDQKEPPIFKIWLIWGWFGEMTEWGTYFQSENYITRESDTHVASVKITRNTVDIGFWNMPEKELLEKHANGEFDLDNLDLGVKDWEIDY